MLNVLLALSEIRYKEGNTAEMLQILNHAQETAERIKSKSHLADIYTQYYKYYNQSGNWHEALTCHERAIALQDSGISVEKVNRIQNTTLNIERNLRTQQIDKAQEELKTERTTRHIGYSVFAFVLISFMGIIGMMRYVQRIRTRNHQELKRMSSMRETFFTNITHEFRTTLTIILGMAHDLASDNTNSQATQERGRTIERQGHSLLSLINQLLDISKIKSAAGNPDWCNNDITAYITMIVESWRSHAQSHNIDLQYFAQDNIQMDFVPDYVRKVFNNLLSNAFKFTPEYGKVSIEVRREGEQLRIVVQDTGRGMNRETIERIFEPFYQANGDASNIGTGIGLALVKQIINAVEGTISVESSLGKGTKFCIYVPIKQTILNTQSELLEPLCPQGNTLEELENEVVLTDSQSEENQCRLLIVEDNRDIAAYIGTHLSSLYAVYYASNGKEGFDKALEIVPDLIITDLMMPKMDGLELCQEVRKNEILNHIPIVVVTAKISEEERIKGIEAGADAYLAKPFNSDELCTRVEKLLDSRRLLRKKFAQSLLEQDREESKEEDTSSLLQRESDTYFLTHLTDTVFLLISKHEPLGIPTIAAKMCMSYSQFYRKLSSLTGLTPSEYIQRVRIQHAQQVKKEHPDLSYSEIAELCGFKDYSTFVRAFKAVYGSTPKQTSATP